MENLHVKFCAFPFENTVVSTEEELRVFSLTFNTTY